MIITIILSVLWLMVIAAGVMALLKGFEKPTGKGMTFVGGDYKKEKDATKIYGGVLTGVGLVGLITTLYMWFSGHSHAGDDAPKSNFGFRFY